jgi:hypothetical protein
MNTLKFKKEYSGVYNASSTLHGDIYTFAIESGSSKYWGLSVYKNDAFIWGDGWDNSTKKTWVIVSERIVKDLLEGIEI